MSRNVEVVARFADELRVAAATAGLTQRQIGTRARISQSEVSRIAAGRQIPSLAMADRLARATGHRLVIQLVPAGGIRLRDSGQMDLAVAIRAQAHARWRVVIEVPVAHSPDLRAADLVLEQPSEIVHIEIERWLRDFQAQVRRAQLKRQALTERLDRPVRLVIAVRDSAATRHLISSYAEVVSSAFPVTARAAWAAIRSGAPLGGDALIWVRPIPARSAVQVQGG